MDRIVTVLFAVGLDKDGWPRLYLPGDPNGPEKPVGHAPRLDDSAFRNLLADIPAELRPQVLAIVRHRLAQMTEQAQQLPQQASEIYELIDQLRRRLGEVDL
jgi:hypothetical protein